MRKKWLSATKIRTKTNIKSDSHLPKNCFICFNEIPFKNNEQCFLFHLKALFVLKIFKFLS